MYISLIRSRIDYASFLYTKAAKCHLEKLDKIQYKAIRIITGNFTNTIRENLEAEINLMPLKYRREELALLYFGKVCRMPKHPVSKMFEKFSWCDREYRGPHHLPAEGRTKILLNKLKIPIKSIETFKNKDLYIPNNINVKFNLLKDKNTYPIQQFQHDFNYLVENEYSNFIKVYTDGSKTKKGCGCAFFTDTNPPVIINKKVTQNMWYL